MGIGPLWGNKEENGKGVLAPEIVFADFLRFFFFVEIFSFESSLLLMFVLSRLTPRVLIIVVCNG